MRHGLRSGKLPKATRYIENRVNELRRQLEDAVTECKGKISVSDAAYINTAIRWETHAALARRWLTKNEKTMDIEQQLRFSKEEASASDKRDYAISCLELGERSTNIIDALYIRRE
jgi:hypothetical protein